MNRAGKLAEIRGALSSGQVSLGSWIQLRDGSTAEIMGAAGYDWVAVDMEHGSISVGDLPDIFRALELGGTLPLVRLAEGTSCEARSALDAGAAGVIIPMIESAEQLASLRTSPVGLRPGAEGSALPELTSTGLVSTTMALRRRLHYLLR